MEAERIEPTDSEALRSSDALENSDFDKFLAAAHRALNLHPICLGRDLIIILLNFLSRGHVNDHVLVGKLLDALFVVDGHFFHLFVDALMIGDDVAEDDVVFAGYLLAVGAKKVYKVQNRLVPMIDVPFSNLTLAGIALRRGRPRALRLFLRHGADPQTALNGLVGMRLNPRRLLGKWENSLTLLSSAVPTSRRLSALLPRLSKRINTLKHLCKVVIRASLSSAGYLPDGIYALCLPRELHRYLDL